MDAMELPLSVKIIGVTICALVVFVLAAWEKVVGWVAKLGSSLFGRRAARPGAAVRETSTSKTI